MDFLLQPVGGRVARQVGAAVAALALVASIGGAQSRTAQVTSRGAVTLPPPSPDPRIGLKAGLFDAGEAIWNLKMVSTTPPTEKFLGSTNSDLAFTGKYAIQGNYNGWQIWDISNPAAPVLATAYYCPASQSDVSVYKNLLFISGEGTSGRLDCGAQGVREAVSKDRLRGLRIFDITDIKNPKNVGNVQTCRGSHTHTVLVDPKDKENVYVYISGSAGVRSEQELPGCSNKSPKDDPNSALFRIEAIKVPVAHPEQAAIVSSPRIFNDLVEPPRHGLSAADKAEQEKAKARGAFFVEMEGETFMIPNRMVRPMLDSTARARGNTTGTANAADSAALRDALPAIMARMFGGGPPSRAPGNEPRPGPTQCHDITVYPGIGLAGGACGGYGLLIDIKDPVNPVRIGAAADSNFSYWHSATFSNDGSKVLFTDEWGGGGAPKCREGDPKEWGANALFTLENGKMTFKSYYKLPVAQTSLENCVAHNGSLIPVPGRDLFIQSWYQGGISLMDWTDIEKPMEIAFHDRGPVDSTSMGNGGSWSVYWYNGVIVNSEISRGLDIFELTPSEYISQNEIDAAKTVKLDYLNTQGQPKFVWPASYAKARAFADQLERSKGLSGARLSSVRSALDGAEKASGARRTASLTALAKQLDGDANGSSDAGKVKMLAGAVRELMTMK
jgi:hypothetical protein